MATQIHSIFSLFLNSQSHFEGSDDEASQGKQTIRGYPPPLLLVSSNQSSPAQDLERFLSTGADIVIGTPGRVEEFLLGKGRDSVSVKELEVLVLDEADRCVVYIPMFGLILIRLKPSGSRIPKCIGANYHPPSKTTENWPLQRYNDGC